MKGNLVRVGLIALCLQLSCNAAHAVTWFESNVRPDGASDASTNTSSGYNNGTTIVLAPSDDNAQVVQSGGSSDSAAEVVGGADVYDSGD